jgi:integrase/recombinase XerC
VLLFLFSGGHLAEIAGLRWEHVKLSAGVITFKGTAGAKNGRDRTVPIHPRLAEELQRVPPAARRLHLAVVDDRRARNLKAKGLAKRLQVWLSVHLATNGVALPHIHPHKLRHTFASVHVWHATDLRTLQELLGHAQLGTTEHYVKVRDVEKRRAMERFPGFLSPGGA